jgi:hypothetical protein
MNSVSSEYVWLALTVSAEYRQLQVLGVVAAQLVALEFVEQSSAQIIPGL